MSKIKRNVLLPVGIGAAGIIVVIFATFASGLVLLGTSLNSNQILLGVLATSVGAGIASSLAYIFYRTSRARERRRILETEEQFQTEELFRLSQEELELEKQRTNLEKQQQTLLWVLAAAESINDDPRLAIITVYQGLESEIQNLITRKYQVDTEETKQEFSISYNYDILAKYIDPDKARVIMQMRDLRNRIVHGEVKPEEITEDKVRNYVQEAGNLALEISRARSLHEA